METWLENPNFICCITDSLSPFEFREPTVEYDEHKHALGDPVKENVVKATDTTPCTYDKVFYCSDCGEELSREKIVVPMLKLDANSLNLQYKKKASLNANIQYGDGLTATWTSSNEKVAKVDDKGNVTTTGKGEATITCTIVDAEDNVVTDTCKVTVKYTWWQWVIIILLFGFVWYK